MKRLFSRFLPLGALAILAANASAQTDIVVDFPDPARFFQSTNFALDGDVAYVASFGKDVLWSFSTVDGSLLDPDGLPLAAGSHAGDPLLFDNDLLALRGVPGAGGLANTGILVVDVSDPTNLREVGLITLPAGAAGIDVDDNGIVGYVASPGSDYLYSFNVNTLSLEDPDGVALPGNPDRISIAGDRVAIADTGNGDVIVVDVSNPANLLVAGTINLPGTVSLSSNDNIVFADDGRSGFISSNQRVLYSFDAIDLVLLDPDGLVFGTSGGLGGNVAIHGDTVGALSSQGLAFIDVSDPTNMQLISNADFGGPVASQGSATVAFSANEKQAATSVIWPGDLIYTFDVATGQQISQPFPVDDGPNYLTVFDGTNRVAVICTRGRNIHLIEGLLDASISIDIRPWSAHNFINPFSRLLIPVALLGSDDIDVADVDVTTLAFGPNGAAAAFDLTNPLVLLLSLCDVNGDDKTDLLSYYRTEETDIAMGQTEACLTGETLDGASFRGCDAITTAACGHGFEAALVVPPLVWIGGRVRRRRR